ncbi:protein O-linked-mannose beta-1,2-N-acetylglucosaminyltransferase 1-like isoform X2 [Eriocheir sinensis]|nr:protein O-linked-mannose beta-1,2-N-acetylglucosaminyltransferase 1-like isoform X2 [Eriocheir sinensis]
MVGAAYLLAILCLTFRYSHLFVQDLIEKEDTDIRKSSNYESLNNFTSAWGPTLPKTKKDEKPVVSGIKRDTYLNIDVSVSKWMLEVKVDMKVILYEKMVMADIKFMKKGGMYLLVLNPTTATVMHFSKHRTFERSGDRELLRVVKGVQPGRILVFAALHEGFMQMSDLTVGWMRKTGSRAIFDMTMGDRWAWIWTKGGQTWAEGAVFARDGDSLMLQGGPLRLQANLPRSTLYEVECSNWPNGKRWSERKRFCNRFEGYGDLCSCKTPELLPSNQMRNKKGEWGESTIPTVVVASERPLLLHRCLRRLMSVAGSSPERTLVVADGDLDGRLQEVQAVVSLYGIMFEGHDAGGNNVTLRITRHYKTVMDAAFRTFPDDPYVILLEEDLYVASDFFSYFAQTAPLLMSDPTLYCVSAWNDLARDDSGGNPRLVMRSETMAGLGWLLSKKVYQDVITKWPAHDKFADWDMWMRLPEIQQGRECLVPEVSRTFHFGSKGAHLTDYFQANFYAHASFNTMAHVTLADLDMLGPTSYDQHLKELLFNGVHLDGDATNPCSKTLLPRNSSSVYILWIKMNEARDEFTYMGVMSCLRLWNLDLRAHHKLLWRLRWKGTCLLVVGWPASPFSVLKPKEVRVLMRYDPLKPEEEFPVYKYLSTNKTTSINTSLT